MSTLPMNQASLPSGGYGSRQKQYDRQRLMTAGLRQRLLEGEPQMVAPGWTSALTGTQMSPMISAPDTATNIARALGIGLTQYNDNQITDAENTDATNKQADYKKAMSNFPKLMMGTNPDGTPRKLTEDEYIAKAGEWAGNLDGDNDLLAPIRASALSQTLAAPEKMFAREDRQKEAQEAYKLKELENARLAAERNGDRVEAARLQHEFLKETATQQQSLQMSIANQASADRRYGIDNRASGVNNPMNYSPELLTAINEGRVPMSGLNSRTAPLYDQLAKNNPTGDFTKIKMDQVLGMNPTYQTKAQAISYLPEVMDNVRIAGAALNYPENAPAAAVNQWMDKYGRNPDYTHYLTQRNDAMMTITNAMRGIGMSDKSIQMEQETLPTNASPKQFDAWYNAQIKALKPRTDATDKSLHKENKPVLTKTVDQSKPKAMDLDSYLKSQGH